MDDHVETLRRLRADESGETEEGLTAATEALELVPTLRRERDELRERVKALEKQAALDLDAMREALASMKRQRELMDQLFAEAKGWHDQAASDRAKLGRLEEWATEAMDFDLGRMSPSETGMAAEEVLCIIRGGGE